MSAKTNAEAAISILSGIDAKIAIANATKGYAESLGDLQYMYDISKLTI